MCFAAVLLAPPARFAKCPTAQSFVTPDRQLRVRCACAWCSRCARSCRLLRQPASWATKANSHSCLHATCQAALLRPGCCLWTLLCPGLLPISTSQPLHLDISRLPLLPACAHIGQGRQRERTPAHCKGRSFCATGVHAMRAIDCVLLFVGDEREGRVRALSTRVLCCCTSVVLWVTA